MQESDVIKSQLFWKWMLVNIIVMTVYWAIYEPLRWGPYFSPLQLFPNPDGPMLILLLTGYSLVLGLAHWFVLKSRLEKIRLLIGGVSAGIILGFVAKGTLIFFLRPLFNLWDGVTDGLSLIVREDIFGGAVWGSILGLGQWFVLRKRLPRAGLLLMANIVALSAGSVVANGIIFHIYSYLITLGVILGILLFLLGLWILFRKDLSGRGWMVFRKPVLGYIAIVIFIRIISPVILDLDFMHWHVHHATCGAFGGILLGLTYGLITGTTLCFLFEERKG